MIVTLTVSVSGPAFTFIIYENLKSRFSQEGFLIGDFSEREVKTITDNDQQQVHLFRVIRISCAVPCPQPFFFYNGIGRIDPERIKNFLGDLAPKVVGWYKYKPSSGINFTFREKVIHRQLADLFHLPSEFFSCCLLISESSDNNATHSFTQTFMRYHNNSFEQLPLRIINLSHNNVLYKSPEQDSEAFSNLMKTLDISDDQAHGLKTITNIQTVLDKHTERIVNELTDMENRLFQLENEVKHLKENVKEKDPNSASNIKENSVNDVINTDAGLEVSPVNSPARMKGRGKSNTPLKTRKNNQSPGSREILTRSKKKV